MTIKSRRQPCIWLPTAEGAAEQARAGPTGMLREQQQGDRRLLHTIFSSSPS